MHKHIFLLFFWLFLALSAEGIDREKYRLALGDRPGWYVGIGSVFDPQMSPVQAQREALKQARQDAMEQATGVQISSLSLVTLGVVKGNYSEARSMGWVARSWTMEQPLPIMREFTEQNRKMVAPEYWIVEACSVVVPKAGAPSFSLQGSLDKGTYSHGEEGILEVRADADCFLTIFGLWADESLALVFPNSNVAELFLKAGETFRFPDEKRWPGLALQFFTLPGDEENTEYYKIVATKTKHPFLGGFGPAALQEVKLSPACRIGVIRDPDAALREFCDWFFSIPPEEVAVEVVGYRVVRK